MTVNQLRQNADGIIRDRLLCDVLLGFPLRDGMGMEVSRREAHDDFADVALTLVDLLGRGLYLVRTAHSGANDVWWFSSAGKAHETYHALREHYRLKHQGCSTSSESTVDDASERPEIRAGP